MPKVSSYPANQNSIIKNGFHRAIFEVLKAKIKGVFSRSFCCYGNLLRHENDNNVFAMIGRFSDAVTSASIGKEWF